MLAPLFAALVCVVPPAMSLPPDGAAQSVPLQSGDELMSPATIECVPAAAQSTAAACASRWTADMIGSCDLVRATHAHLASVGRARARTSGRSFAGGTVAPAPEPLASDSHSTPPLFSGGVALIHPPFSSSRSATANGTPPSPPSRRLDRPPRA